MVTDVDDDVKYGVRAGKHHRNLVKMMIRFVDDKAVVTNRQMGLQKLMTRHKTIKTDKCTEYRSYT